jgi:hypothetical protein
MSVNNVRSEANPLFAFTLMIGGAFAAGLPMAVAIIWVCSRTYAERTTVRAGRCARDGGAA